MRIGGAVRSLLLFALLTLRLSPAQQAVTYSEAKQAFDQKNYLDAARLFGAVAALQASRSAGSPTDALLMQARSLVKAGKFAAAEPAARAYLVQNRRSATGLYLLGFVLESENKARESLQVFGQAAALSTPRAEDLRLVALDYVLLDDYLAAIHWLKRALAEDPKNTEAWYDLGRANMHQGDFVESEHDFEQVLALNPQEPRALNNLGLSYEAQNRTDEALVAYSRAVGAQKNVPAPSEQPLLNLGALLNTRNRSAEAVAALEQAVAITPTCGRCHEELSRAYTGTGATPFAIREMERAVELDPRNPALHFQLSRLYRAAGFGERAKRELKESSDLYGSRSATTEEGRSGQHGTDIGTP